MTTGKVVRTDALTPATRIFLDRFGFSNAWL
jgi:hypothetical protein